ncbi:uncharacterized protein K489DRAFT_245412 [Dissoconium aciculare CBS 342.82]|uniref:Uncharacterized protein n=1 Tax=Dissoconium aciculare CBS 342.82 TaxID=1314786 RepID=A0A6J3M6K8_9PEZI|nr:uncharacterized protein K489DRAFT_245412 [Dissoconium aciculare CBS 342.82]KAF1822507.1 hypothetical protein K489DRAFT_245412 [Dissoconium aciculare CBS 342.82]
MFPGWFIYSAFVLTLASTASPDVSQCKKCRAHRDDCSHCYISHRSESDGERIRIKQTSLAGRSFGSLITACSSLAVLVNQLSIHLITETPGHFPGAGYVAVWAFAFCYVVVCDHTTEAITSITRTVFLMLRLFDLLGSCLGPLPVQEQIRVETHIRSDWPLYKCRACGHHRVHRVALRVELIEVQMRLNVDDSSPAQRSQCKKTLAAHMENRYALRPGSFPYRHSRRDGSQEVRPFTFPLTKKLEVQCIGEESQSQRRSFRRWYLHPRGSSAER